MISGADFAKMFGQLKGSKPEAVKAMAAGLAKEGMAPLSGCTPEGLAQQVADHAATWSFRSEVDALKTRPIFVITSDDGLAQTDNAFADALRKAGNAQVTTLHLATDHAYSDQRTELSAALLKWLAVLK
jgi:uncharacterized protein